MSTTSRDFFERMYETSPDPWSFTSSEYEQQRYAKTLEFVPPGCFRSVFEPGCSIGELTAGLADRCGHVTAIDIAESAVESARQRCRRLDNVDVHQGSLIDDMPPGPFDLVVFSEIGYYFTEPQLISVGFSLASRMEASGQLLAVHWTGVSPDHVLSGGRVHEILRRHLPMERLHHEVHSWDDRDGFVLDLLASVTDDREPAFVSDTSDLERELRDQLECGVFTLPDPAKGHTAERHRLLLEIGRADLQIARVAEAHTDAVAILHEAGRTELAGALYGVWAAEDPSCRLRLFENRRTPGGFVLSGTKAFCTGATIIDRALVTVRHADAAYLLDVDVRHPRVRFDHDGWRTPAFADTITSVATFDDLEVDEVDIVGAPGWYLDRVGFWHGACGPAACWAGGAVGLVDRALEQATHKPADPHRDAHSGALAALRWQLLAALDVAGREIDADPDHVVTAMQRALMLRHTVERAATSIIDLYGRAMGPRPLIQDAEIVRRVSELQLYIRQHHDEHDLESIGRSFRDPDA